MLEEDYNNIISQIKNKSFTWSDYFSLAKDINIILDTEDSFDKQLARNIVIYIIDNWISVPQELRKLYTDIITKCGFYPYLEKEQDFFYLDNLRGEISKEFHKANYLKGNIYFHSAQQEVCDLLLNTESNLVISAPTSFGKSLLIEELVASNKYNNIVVIQPTLALLNETRNNLRKYEDKYKIIVRVADKPVKDKGNLFLLTAERVMEYKDMPKIDMFILDEFYKISQKRDDERYEVLNNACNKMLNEHKSRFYFLGPHIDKISQEFIDKYNVIFKKYDYTLVVNEENEIKKGETYYNDNRVEIKEKRLFEELVRYNEQTIIYCSSPQKSTETAINFAKYLESLDSRNLNAERDVPLIQWINDHVSYKWEISSCLRHRIGVHNGVFPKHVNASIIDYFNDGKLLYLFCTSTIIEGVNTTAKNVILYNNWRGPKHKKIDYFDYKNIKGRSGRMFKHYVGNLYSFYQKFEEEAIEIDIPFVDQEKPLSKEILVNTPEEDIKDKSSQEYQELLSIPKEELNLFKKNGLSIDGQKKILEYLKTNINRDYHLIKWNYYPNYEQALYILDLCFKNLMKPTETGGGITSKKLAQLIKICNRLKNLYAVVKNEVKYLHEQHGKDYNSALTSGFQIQRHWFDYKLPKWFGCFNELQKYVCNLYNLTSGDYSLFLAMLENDYMSPRASLLMEFDLPKTAIRKIDNYIPEYINDDEFIPYIRQNYQDIVRNALLSNYEYERLKKEIL